MVHTRSTFGVKNFASCIKNEIESNGLNVEYCEDNLINFFKTQTSNRNKTLQAKEETIIATSICNPKFLTARSFVVIHDLIPLSSSLGFSRVFYFKEILKYLYLFLRYRYLKDPVTFICISRSTYQDAIKWSKRLGIYRRHKFIYGYQTVGLKKSLSFPQKDKCSVLSDPDIEMTIFSGNRPHKNIQLTSEFLKSYKEGNLTLNVIGEMPVEVRVHDSTRLVSHANISNQGVVDILEKSTFLLYPSIVEGMGLPIYEALAVGCIPIIYPSEVNKEVLGSKYPYFVEKYSDIIAIIKSIDLNDVNRIAKHFHDKAQKVFDSNPITQAIITQLR